MPSIYINILVFTVTLIAIKVQYSVKCSKIYDVQAKLFNNYMINMNSGFSHKN